MNKMMNGAVGRALALALLISNAGCFSTWDVSPKALHALSGFHEPAQVPLVDEDGSEFAFDRTTQLRFNGANVPPTKFSSIQVNGPVFTGQARPDGQPIMVDLRQVRSVQVKKFSTLKTVLAAAIPLAVLTIFSIVVLAVAGQSSSGGD